jgi:hypothetical protein
VTGKTGNARTDLDLSSNGQYLHVLGSMADGGPSTFNEGLAPSPPIDLSAVMGSATLNFWCNWSTEGGPNCTWIDASYTSKEPTSRVLAG